MNAVKLARGVSRIWLLGGYAFLYLPIVALIVYSFNDSPVPEAWTGFTLKWFGLLGQDEELMGALGLSARVAFFSATAAVALGLLAAWTIVKLRRFRGRALFIGMINAPLLMPEVIVGLSLMLFLVSLQHLLGFPRRGFVTIWLGHVLLCLSYATIVIEARLRELPAQLEEAALDLGAQPWQVFWLVTLPLIGQSLASAWLLSFTLSLDDVVLSEFLSGPGATTLPMVIFSRARLGLSPLINAVATVIVVVVSLGVIAASLWLARQGKNKQENPA
ncbi:MAG: ABC transporter permease subunit [Paucibacter sp.]|nr:ABC transporter permease subunit [Roseateles sp.]